VKSQGGRQQMMMGIKCGKNKLGFWRSKFVKILIEARKSEILTKSTLVQRIEKFLFRYFDKTDVKT
jgi:hypothetical protein